MKVLMTGATGFVGSNVLEYLHKNTDWEFTLLCNWRHIGGPNILLPDDRFEVITHDLTEPIPEIGDFDYILNLAAESHVDRSIADPLNFIENNVSSVLQMLEYARKHPPKVFIQFSTDEVYGATNHKEWDVLLPSNPYAASKACQEMIAISYWKTYGLPIVITNSNNIVGKNQNPEKFIPKIIELIKNDQEVLIHTTGSSPGKRHYNPVENIADALLFIIDFDWKNYGGDKDLDRPYRFNIPGGQLMDNLEMAQLVAKILGKELKYKLVDAETVRPGYDEFYGETEGTLTGLGWKPKVTLEEGLQWIKSL
jgi:dTDP-glucose 4,6-dehydratase